MSQFLQQQQLMQHMKSIIMVQQEQIHFPVFLISILGKFPVIEEELSLPTELPSCFLLFTFNSSILLKSISSFFVLILSTDITSFFSFKIFFLISLFFLPQFSQLCVLYFSASHQPWNIALLICLLLSIPPSFILLPFFNIIFFLLIKIKIYRCIFQFVFTSGWFYHLKLIKNSIYILLSIFLYYF